MFKQKIIVSLIIILFLLGFSCTIFADELDYEENYVWTEEEVSQAKQEKELIINSKVAIAYDRKSKEILYSKNEEQKVKMASTTKIMTAIILLENVNDLNEQVEVCKQAALIGGSRLGLKTGDKITYNDLLYGLLLCSGNDAGIQIAISVSGYIEEFAKLMNNKVKELGLENTHFVTPHGLDNEEHFTTALELAKITDYALDIDKFKEVVATKNYTVTINNYTKTISNTNELLGNLQGVNGVKTGFTNGAGRCLVTSVDRDGFNIITVILGADTKKIRTKDSINLIEYVYKNYERINLQNMINEEFNNWKKLNEERIYVEKGVSNNLNLKLDLSEEKYIDFPINKQDKEKIQININCINCIEAPVKQNELIGILTVSINGKEISSINIVNKNEIKKKNILDYFIILLRSGIRCQN